MFLNLLMDWFLLLVVISCIFCKFSYCTPDLYINQLKSVQHSPIRHVSRRSVSQHFHSNENPLSNFEIRRNTIIRTQDSRAMGAEYLNEMQKPSNDACLMWCLEHQRCNVAVFEEKNNRSCYLFDCGSLTDFRCNFTSYTYYVSSILRGSQHSFDLKQWPSQAKHESELTSLRKSAPQSSEPVAEPKEQATVIPSPISPRETPVAEARTRQRELVEEQPSPNNWTPEPSCQHFQFQCRSNKECIAIYNVCDGIPQCPDGSDEGKDLQCPQSEEPVKTTLSSTPSPPPLPPTPTTPATEPPPPPPIAAVVPQIPEKVPVNSDVAAYQQNRAEDIPVVDDAASSYGLQDSGKVESAWTQYQQQQQQQALANAQQEEFVAPVREPKPAHNLYPPQHALFQNKHSSFHPASSVSYRPSIYQSVSNNNNNNNNHQWNNDYYNSEGYEAPRVQPSEVEYSGGYDTGYRSQSTLNNNNFRMGPLKVGGHAPQPFDHYRPSSPYWATEDQLLNKGSYVKTNDIPLVQDMSHPQMNSRVSHYVHPMLGQATYPQQQQQPQPQLMSPSKSYNGPNKPQYSLPLENNQMYLPHRGPMDTEMKGGRPVVQPQVQNDGSQEDAIYDPQADVPHGMVDMDISHIPHQVQRPMHPVTVMFQMTSSTVAPPSPSTTTTKKPVHKGPPPHALIHSVSHSHVSAVSAESGMTISELQQASRIHSHESNGAVLALTLGLSITAILMVLVACRLRNLRRRLSRRGGRSSLAHDADYLVNGMYL